MKKHIYIFFHKIATKYEKTVNLCYILQKYCNTS